MQNNNSWQVIAEGVIESHGTKESIVAAVSKAFKIDEQKTRQLLDGTARVVKKNVPRVEAEKYRSLLIGLGVKASIRRMPQVATVEIKSVETLTLEPIVEASRSQIGSSSINGGEIVCPKCGAKQKHSDECNSCGIIIARYQQMLDERDNQVENNEFHSEPPSILAIPKIYLVAAALVVVLCWKLFFSSSGYLPVGNNSHVVAQINAITESFNKPRINLQSLRALIESGRYADAEKVIQDLHDKTIVDILWEEAYQSTLDGIASENKFSLESLNQWVNSSDSAIAHLARGGYYVSAGVSARGGRFAKDTSQEQFNNESRLYELGVKDLQKALAIDSTLFPAYTFLIMTIGSSDKSAQEYLAAATKIAPGGYYFRYQYLRGLMPKWGGSYAEMNGFTDTLDEFSSVNPRLWQLKGFALAEEAHTAMHKDNFKTAISLYSEALQFGIARDWLTKRAYALEMEGEDKKALNDINLALEYYKTLDNAEQVRMKIHLEKKL